MSTSRPNPVLAPTVAEQMAIYCRAHGHPARAEYWNGKQTLRVASQVARYKAGPQGEMLPDTSAFSWRTESIPANWTVVRRYLGY